MMSNQAKVLMGVLIAVIVFAVAVVWLATRPKEVEPEPESAAPDLGGLADTISDAVAVEAPSANPYQDVPSLNPVEQANPFSNVKINPFAR